MVPERGSASLCCAPAVLPRPWLFLSPSATQRRYCSDGPHLTVDRHDARRQAATPPVGFKPTRADPSTWQADALAARPKRDRVSTPTLADFLVRPLAEPLLRLPALQERRSREKAGGCGSPANQQDEEAQKQQLQLQGRLADIRARVRG
jgi:hypothetical protein